MRGTRTRLTQNQWLELGWALPAPHKSFIRLHKGFLWLCWWIRSGLRCSRETSQSLPRLTPSLSEVSWACNTAFVYKPKGAGAQPHSRTQSRTQIHHEKKKMQINHMHTTVNTNKDKEQHTLTSNLKLTHIHPNTLPSCSLLLALFTILWQRYKGPGL